MGAGLTGGWGIFLFGGWAKRGYNGGIILLADEVVDMRRSGLLQIVLLWLVLLLVARRRRQPLPQVREYVIDVR
ncbi:MAG: hypothetical protein HPY45_17310 [Anaerolineae bacterium]|nr:hypothetical protein [Anaerolineae bacterium]